MNFIDNKLIIPNEISKYSIYGKLDYRAIYLLDMIKYPDDRNVFLNDPNIYRIDKKNSTRFYKGVHTVDLFLYDRRFTVMILGIAEKSDCYDNNYWTTVKLQSIDDGQLGFYIMTKEDDDERQNFVNRWLDFMINCGNVLDVDEFEKFGKKFNYEEDRL